MLEQGRQVVRHIESDHVPTSNNTKLGLVLVMLLAGMWVMNSYPTGLIFLVQCYHGALLLGFLSYLF